MNNIRAHSRRLFQAIVLTIALLIGSVPALASVSTASAATLIPLVDMGGPGGGGGSGASDLPELARHQNQLSIDRIESNQPPGGVLAGAELPANALTANQHSLALGDLEELQAGVEVAFTPGQALNFCIECGAAV